MARMGDRTLFVGFLLNDEALMADGWFAWKLFECRAHLSTMFVLFKLFVTDCRFTTKRARSLSNYLDWYEGFISRLFKSLNFLFVGPCVFTGAI